jgi:hypothetical protein
MLPLEVIEPGRRPGHVQPEPGADRRERLHRRAGAHEAAAERAARRQRRPHLVRDASETVPPDLADTVADLEVLDVVPSRPEQVPAVPDRQTADDPADLGAAPSPRSLNSFGTSRRPSRAPRRTPPPSRYRRSARPSTTPPGRRPAELAALPAAAVTPPSSWRRTRRSTSRPPAAPAAGIVRPHARFSAS